MFKLFSVLYYNFVELLLFFMTELVSVVTEYTSRITWKYEVTNRFVWINGVNYVHANVFYGGRGLLS